MVIYAVMSGFCRGDLEKLQLNFTLHREYGTGTGDGYLREADTWNTTASTYFSQYNSAYVRTWSRVEMVTMYHSRKEQVEFLSWCCVGVISLTLWQVLHNGKCAQNAL